MFLIFNLRFFKYLFVNDIGTEELAHLEIVGSIVRQLLKNASEEDIRKNYGDAYVDHGKGIYTMSAGGVPYNAFSMQVKGDPITDISEDMGADAATKKSNIAYTKPFFDRIIIFLSFEDGV